MLAIQKYTNTINCYLNANTTLNDYELVDNSLSLNFNELLLFCRFALAASFSCRDCDIFSS